MESIKNIHAKGMVFGVFDTFHKGHEYFLSQAKQACDELVVVVALPHIVEAMKKKTPQDTLEERMANIKNFDKSLVVVPGDQALGEWSVITSHAPSHIFLGHDQQKIATELEKL